MTLAARLRGLARFDALVLTASLWFFGKFLRYAFPPLFGTLGESYGVSRTVLGTTFTGFMLVYAAMQFPSGALADRLGSVRVLVAGTGVAAVGALVLVVDAPLWVLVAAMLLMGAGTGAYKTVGVRLLSGIYPSRTGRALGVFDTFGTFGGVAAPAAVVAVTGHDAVGGAGWRTVFLAGGLATVGLALAFGRRVPRRLASSSTASTGSDHGDVTASPDSYLTMFREWQFTGFVLVTICFSFAYNGAVAFLPLYLASETALSSATANLLFSALFVVSLVQLVTGEVSDRIGTAPVLLVTLAVATAGLLAILTLAPTGGPLALGGAVVALGLGAHGYRPVRGAYLMAVVPEDVAGGSLGVVRTLLMGAGAVAPAIVGWLSDVASFRVAFGLLAAALVGATGLTAALWLFDR
ncbi:MFS transporter [Halomicrobium sp. LC1Hm]|uniref:MFS transporter n=1 Tax=Halomicrobium sp. LC1Hm TaxID=2610902 RepID=UPI00129830B4|nr:MFS transporter [Halomicrobium sp. LC1Hm]QGA83880.1 MFS family permease [Halomicrobium sp. LC1Hm]